MNFKIFILISLISSFALAVSNKVLEGDVWKNPAHTKVFTPPSATDTLVGRASTDTLTNKSISGSTNTFTNIPANTALTGVCPVANGCTNSTATPTAGGVGYGTGTAHAYTGAITANEVVLGNGSSAPFASSTNGWYIWARLGGSNISLGTSGQINFIEMTDTGLTLTPASGSAAAGIMCTGTNAATAPSTSPTVCSGVAESVGINFSVPIADVYEVCVNYSHLVTLDTAAAALVYFRITETATNGQTPVSSGINILGSGGTGMTIATGANGDILSSKSQCEPFSWASGTHAIRLMYVQTINGTPDANLIMANQGAGADGGKQITISVFPKFAR